MGPDPDLLGTAAWECASTGAGEAGDPEVLTKLPLAWIPASVPGTVAGALRQAGVPERGTAELDGEDWWFRTRFEGPEGPEGPEGAGGPVATDWLLELEGLATLADVWLNGVHLARSEAMFTPLRLPVGSLDDHNLLVIRFAALAPWLTTKRPRPRWKSNGATHQNLRWIRTTLLGRQPGWVVTPAPVGPWRPVRLVPWSTPQVVDRRLVTHCRVTNGFTAGTVTVDLKVTAAAATGPGSAPAPTATLDVGGVAVPLAVVADGDHLRLSGTATVDDVERWWPHTHGSQPLYPVAVQLGPDRLDLGSVGFRTVEVDTAHGGFGVVVNGTPVFCRGGCWYPLDPVSLQASEEELLSTLTLVQEAGMNMVRIPGGTVYEGPSFFSLCDRLGLMVWQDAMFAFLDPPDDPEFVAGVVEELTGVLSGAAAHPSLTVVCGGQELEEQPAMFGLSRDRWSSVLADEIVPELSERLAPGVPYVPSSPHGGSLPFQMDRGVSHYTGVGVYLRPLDDLRRAEVAFVSEGLAFAIPPERDTVDEECGGAQLAGHDPAWKQAIHHDTGGSWDLEDVRDHYVQRLWGEDPALLRRHDPERALDLGRATVTHIMSEAVSEWRRTGSRCAGLLLVGLRDLRIGAGWGIIDARGAPKAPWFALARASQPVGLLLTDEGLNGLAIHLVNDGGQAVVGRVEVAVYSADHRIDEGSAPAIVPARGGVRLAAEDLFDGFRDLTYAYRFGPRRTELVVARLVGEEGAVLAAATFLPDGPSRSVQAEVGLQATLHPVDEQAWSLSVSTRRFAQYVAVDVPGFRPDDSWFHLEPGGSRVVGLHRVGSGDQGPKGQVRALNSEAVARVAL
jgi:beta-mannosidase